MTRLRLDPDTKEMVEDPNGEYIKFEEAVQYLQTAASTALVQLNAATAYIESLVSQ